jgi:hypothetical protein
MIGVSKLHRLVLKEGEIEKVCFYYADKLDGSSDVAYKNFIGDIDSVFTEKPSNQEPAKQRKVSVRDWSDESDAIRYTCINALLKIREVIEQRELLVFPWFRDYDG